MMDKNTLTILMDLNRTFSVGNRVDDPLQKVGTSSPVVACKNIQQRHSNGVAGWRYGCWIVKGCL